MVALVTSVVLVEDEVFDDDVTDEDFEDETIVEVFVELLDEEVFADVLITLEDEDEPGISPNHARSSSDRSGTVCPTSRAEKPSSFVPSPYTIFVYPVRGVLVMFCEKDAPSTLDHSFNVSAKLAYASAVSAVPWYLQSPVSPGFSLSR